MKSFGTFIFFIKFAKFIQTSHMNANISGNKWRNIEATNVRMYDTYPRAVAHKDSFNVTPLVWGGRSESPTQQQFHDIFGLAGILVFLRTI